MPELPEVEVLIRHLAPLVRNQTIDQVLVRRPKVVAPTSVTALQQTLKGSRILSLRRRGKYLVFTLKHPRRPQPELLLGHLGMTGRMYLANASQPFPKHASVVLKLNGRHFIFEDTRYFGRFTLDLRPLNKLGPEPLESKFTAESLAKALARSRQAIKTKLLDQSLLAGIGNIYASEALYRAGIAPHRAACELKLPQIRALWRALRKVLREAIRRGSTVPLNFSGAGKRDGLFYFGRAPGIEDYYVERLQVYDREGQPCPKCRSRIRRIEQAARSTYYCPRCQSD